GSRQPPTGDRKSFTHALSALLLDRLKQLHGSQLKQVVKVAQEALKAKDLQVYFADARAELILRQLGLSSEIAIGNGDGFFVVNTNDGGNKANGFVTERQTDYVTLLPNGCALHRLQVQAPDDTLGTVFSDSATEGGVRGTYLAGDATILGYSGYNAGHGYFPASCPGTAAANIIIDCSPGHIMTDPVTSSDVPGRTMVMGNLL